MNIRAKIESREHSHSLEVATDDRVQSITIAAKPTGFGSNVNGGELLFAALATCFCNDLYREAAKRTITVSRVDVEVTGTFGGPGEPARDVTYRAHVEADAPADVIAELIRATDEVTEIQNTLRAGCLVRLVED